MSRACSLAGLLLASQLAMAEPTPDAIALVGPADRACAIKDAWTQELEEVLPEFRASWKARREAMFAAVASLTQRPVEPFIVPVRLTLCDAPSQSFTGPSVNMRFALRSFTAKPVPLRYKVDTAFHESLHAFITKYTPAGSALLAARKSESTCVLNHLHLLALQKAVLLSLGDAAALEQVIAIDSTLPSGCNKQAWAIVNQSEDAYKPYVAELAS